MSDPKVVSLSVMASKASLLCFEVGGILGESHTELGASVAAFDFAAFYATLGSMPMVPGHPARLLYDFLEIQAFAKKFTLAALRAEPNKAALSKAVNARANAYYAKYANAPTIIAKINAFLFAGNPGFKPIQAGVLSTNPPDQAEKLKACLFQPINRTGVVKKMRRVLNRDERKEV